MRLWPYLPLHQKQSCHSGFGHGFLYSVAGCGNGNRLLAVLFNTGLNTAFLVAPS
ncbi:hypothetical protein BO78DRAFT_47222 [Aspergillus sclerotiicarbonarius CBS 121057]|uniref:Uncharacterized protein n=1 Tax=Aspergillus sclerotiicarbonarius (strain CBS 121057 / IBT 28362) TaxID=1448318 RepID=A0A319ENI4_ASPSB|nr:hypothetical protein BO78DRAFT_47222 [Aspergillus sclerotiicarbonarius CBS 121057]